MVRGIATSDHQRVKIDIEWFTHRAGDECCGTIRCFERVVFKQSVTLVTSYEAVKYFYLTLIVSYEFRLSLHLSHKVSSRLVVATAFRLVEGYPIRTFPIDERRFYMDH